MMNIGVKLFIPLSINMNMIKLPIQSILTAGKEIHIYIPDLLRTARSAPALIYTVQDTSTNQIYTLSNEDAFLVKTLFNFFSISFEEREPQSDYDYLFELNG